AASRAGSGARVPRNSANGAAGPVNGSALRRTARYSAAMWRALLISTLVQVALAGAAQAQAQAWETCRGADGPTGPVLSDCRPLDGPIDPQGRELWLRATVEAPGDARPRALHVAG